ncbi:MAG: hypothetical protein ACFFBP_06790 [Promethearchaeota archaeon]
MKAQNLINYKIESCLVCGSINIEDTGAKVKCLECNKTYEKKVLIDIINYEKIKENHYDDEYFLKWSDDLYAAKDLKTFKHLLTINKECPNCKVIYSKKQKTCRDCGIKFRRKNKLFKF